MYEQYIGGQEIQAAVLDNKAIGAIELIPRRSFYDYKAKYTKSAKSTDSTNYTNSTKSTDSRINKTVVSACFVEFA